MGVDPALQLGELLLEGLSWPPLRSLFMLRVFKVQVPCGILGIVRPNDLSLSTYWVLSPFRGLWGIQRQKELV